MSNDTNRTYDSHHHLHYYYTTGKKQLDLAEQVVDICIAHTSTTTATIASYPHCAENYVIVIIIAAEVPASLLLSLSSHDFMASDGRRKSK